jgi:hypothetical protein
MNPPPLPSAEAGPRPPLRSLDDDTLDAMDTGGPQATPGRGMLTAAAAAAPTPAGPTLPFASGPLLAADPLLAASLSKQVWQCTRFAVVLSSSML